MKKLFLKNHTDTLAHSYFIPKDYFEEIMLSLGRYLMKRYHEVDVVPLTEILGQIMCINYLTTPQKLYLAAWFGSNRDTYEYKILGFLKKEYESIN